MCEICKENESQDEGARANLLRMLNSLDTTVVTLYSQDVAFGVGFGMLAMSKLMTEHSEVAPIVADLFLESSAGQTTPSFKVITSFVNSIAAANTSNPADIIQFLDRTLQSLVDSTKVREASSNS